MHISDKEHLDQKLEIVRNALRAMDTRTKTRTKTSTSPLKNLEHPIAEKTLQTANLQS